jgi:hypothetical protein
MVFLHFSELKRGRTILKVENRGKQPITEVTENNIACVGASIKEVSLLTYRDINDTLDINLASASVILHNQFNTRMFWC